MSEILPAILLTGAAGGLGRGLAMEFAAKGHRLFLIDQNLDGLRDTLAQLGDHSFLASIHALDATSSDQLRDFLRDVGDQRIDVLINHAGVQHVARVEEFPEEQWDRLLDVMLKGPFLMTKAMLPRMRKTGFGRIINIGSIHSLIASPFKSAYVSAKHGLVGMTRAVALETADVEITVNTICSAYIRTLPADVQIRSQTQPHGISEEDVIKSAMLEPMPKKQFITIEEIAATIGFLMSHHARNITGQTIVIDGGWTVR